MGDYVFKGLNSFSSVSFYTKRETEMEKQSSSFQPFIMDINYAAIFGLQD